MLSNAAVRQAAAERARRLAEASGLVVRLTWSALVADATLLILSQTPLLRERRFEHPVSCRDWLREAYQHL